MTILIDIIQLVWRVLRFLVVWLVLLLAVMWAFGALWFDFPINHLAHGVAFAFIVAVLAALLFVRPTWRSKLGVVIAVVMVAAWWLTIKPTEDRNWQPDVARTGWAEVDGDTVTLHEVRNCDYRTETDFTPRWETRTVQLSKIEGVDVAVNYWGSPWIAHPIVSFRFSDAPPITFSIEARKVVGQNYSTLASLYRQAQLIYIPADERDTIRLRAVFRGEDVYLYRTLVPPEGARERFLEYIRSLNDLHARPRWYNVLTTNCTTTIRQQHPEAERLPWDWRILLNGKGDEMMYDRHMVATGGLSFPELKSRSWINYLAVPASNDPDFWKRIREGVPGFVNQ